MKRLFVIILVMVVLLLNLLPLQSAAQEVTKPPLAEQGPYGVGLQTMTFVDASRADRALEVMVWYPADAGKSSYMMPSYEAAPDASGAPYPMVIYSHGRYLDAGQNFGTGKHLASYGYVVASISHQDFDDIVQQLGQPITFIADIQVVNRPLDVLFVLDQMATLPDDNPLTAVIDANTVGVTGYSYGGLTSLQMNGSRIDPAYLMAWQDRTSSDNEPNRFVGFWDEITAYRAQFGELSEGEMWPPYLDPRIKAVAPQAPCQADLFGDMGLAAASVPTLIVVGSIDDVCPYQDDAVFMYEHFTMDANYLVTLLGVDHMVIFDNSRVRDLYNHFVTAFFGIYLQGDSSYLDYLTPEGVEAVTGVVFGPVETE